MSDTHLTDCVSRRPLGFDTSWSAAAKKTIKVTFIKPSGEKVTVDGPVGDSMLEIAHANNIDIEGALQSAITHVSAVGERIVPLGFPSCYYTVCADDAIQRFLPSLRLNA